MFSCCNRYNTVLTGVSGGTAHRLSLDDQHYYDVALVSAAAHLEYLKSLVAAVRAAIAAQIPTIGNYITCGTVSYVK